jgi:hypothetical protein
MLCMHAHTDTLQAQAMEMSLSSSATAAAAAAQGQLDKATAHLWEQRREFRADLAKAKRLAMTPPDGQDDHPEVSLLLCLQSRTAWHVHGVAHLRGSA